MQPTQEQARRLLKLDSSFRTRVLSSTRFEEADKEKKHPIQVSVQCVDIVCNTTKTLYASATHDNEAEALEAALNKAEAAPKPLTPAQQFDAERQRSTGVIAAKDARIAELEAQLAEAQKPRGRSRQLAAATTDE